MQKIVPHLWFDQQAQEAVSLYTSLFDDSRITNQVTITGTPTGDSEILTFELAQQEFMAINAGPVFTFNPSISFFVLFDNELEIDRVWNALIEQGKTLMALQQYPFAHKYGWLEDKYGLSWQLSWSKYQDGQQKITSFLMFANEVAGKTKEAVEFYTAIFPNSSIEALVPDEKGESDSEGFIKHARFNLFGQEFMAMDNSQPQDFNFNEAISFIVQCENQQEIDTYWEKLSAVPEAEQCGWLKDKYGISWQIVPTAMSAMMERGTKEQRERVTQAFLAMKKFDVDKLQAAFDGRR